jgi:hypothetical protein
MGLHTWRRYHGELTANVMAKAPHAYAVAVWHEPSGVIRQLPRVFRRLESAKAAADDLLRRTFAHTCTVESCGEWLVWST